MSRRDLQADCSQCFALCCVMLRFERSAEFAFDKGAGTPCRNLAQDLTCSIHADLTQRGFAGCVAYDCQGAGPKVSQVVFGGQDWRTDPWTARWTVVVYPIVRQLHEILANLAAELDATTSDAVRADLESCYDSVDRLTRQAPQDLVLVDVAAHRATASAAIRAARTASRPVS